ncbi:MAG: polysaccharide deacetylase [Pseudobutyrivibrio sp.]|nr:polysaccharide deacetylase [Pseudobutyrivibrio sp.]
MKRFIITTIAVFMLVTLCVMTFLVFEVVSLQRQVDVLSAKASVSTDVAESVEMVDDTYLDTVYQVDDTENLLEEGEIPLVYLTFDDGPSDNTDRILDILDDYNVKATFFVVGKDIETYGDQYRRIVDEGHSIGMHSFSHKYSEIYGSSDAFVSDYQKIHQLIFDTTGVDSKLYRFPGGSSNSLCNTSMSVFVDYLNSQNVKYYDWNVDVGDATPAAFSSAEIVDNVMRNVVKYKTSVILMHDASNKDATVEALPELIEALQQNGAMILPITDDTTVIHHTCVVQ